ncbi:MULTISPECIES: PP2C family serine/threonine-protein phosphatase [Aminobacter]|uniref:PP2C family serine/threonine-protein phosphatase n=1 Tax=Aminobacter TaxID=31988 RepID=UPI0024582C08|nr:MULTISPECIES: PP2C family serine/threonine-protein phosphatase [Aminobacter]MDH4986922.1 PP2C family serine/threonine-protein phosphatase [Aminobacter anthyllidis]CAI2931868.1 putative Serine/threonine-protein phosphatase 3 [Aminobacter niigataensis]
MPPAGWRLAQASAIGTSHAGTGAPCQDTCTYSVYDASEGPILVAVVCDGAGSAVHSAVGSWLSAQILLEQAFVHFDGGGRVDEIDRAKAANWVVEIAERIEAHSSSLNHALRDYACTLVAAIVGPESAAFVQIGDGAIVVSHGQDDGWSYVFWPQHGEFANTTNFIVSKNAVDVLDFEIAPRAINEIAIFSDGIENLVLHQASRSVHGDFFDAMFPPVRRSTVSGEDVALSEGLKAYLLSPVICERTDDDKSLLMATRVTTGADR